MTTKPTFSDKKPAKLKTVSKKGGRVPKAESQTESTQVFAAVSSPMRQRILQLLAEDDMHISAIARSLEISVPVASKHIKILEEAQLIDRKIYGKTHVFSLRKMNFSNAFDPFAPVKRLEVEKGTTLMEAFKSIAVVEIKNVDGKDFIVAADGEEGFYLYEINGKLIDKRAEDYLLEEDVVVEWKRLEPVTRKKLIVSVKNEEEKEKRQGYYESLI
ncbi:MAG: helix-turn-helix domain-containing protein [Methanimicrococcus sp.]|nr:helix-turn-helix domain-containing protein [Methanimicrococcus sp.]